uniref:Uncharacterized protein n=1 Tax=Magallana gigas TaxID=29159 RepID=K1R2G3_MAGGI
MKTFIIFLSLLVIAAAQRPETPCLYGKPEGYGRCHMFLSCGKNEECIGNICCRVIASVRNIFDATASDGMFLFEKIK